MRLIFGLDADESIKTMDPPGTRIPSCLTSLCESVSVQSELSSLRDYILHDYYSLEDPGVDGRIILRWIFRKWDVGGMDWIELAQDRDRWRAGVNAVLNLRVP